MLRLAIGGDGDEDGDVGGVCGGDGGGSGRGEVVVVATEAMAEFGVACRSGQ